MVEKNKTEPEINSWHFKKLGVILLVVLLVASTGFAVKFRNENTVLLEKNAELSEMSSDAKAQYEELTRRYDIVLERMDAVGNIYCNQTQAPELNLTTLPYYLTTLQDENNILALCGNESVGRVVTVAGNQSVLKRYRTINDVLFLYSEGAVESMRLEPLDKSRSFSTRNKA
jgi:hypothetical protein